jgi:hypothetical protein
LPDKHVYMAVGTNRQVIMVFPDLDVVAVTTGRSTYSLNNFADSIAKSVKSDRSLPPDASSAKLLAKEILDVSTEKPTQVGLPPALAASISGKVIPVSA